MADKHCIKLLTVKVIRLYGEVDLSIISIVVIRNPIKNDQQTKCDPCPSMYQRSRG